MQEQDCGENGGSSQILPGKVCEMRRQWAVHEDEALAYRLQSEEITQHYCGNRTRNALVREDTPRAREEQRREEQEALEERLRQLQLLQMQADEDSRLAKELAERYDMGMEPGSNLQQSAVCPAPVDNHDPAGASSSSPRNSKALEVDQIFNACEIVSSSSNSSSSSSLPKVNNSVLVGKSSPAGNSSKSPTSSCEKKTKSIMKPAGSYRDRDDFDWAGAACASTSAVATSSSFDPDSSNDLPDLYKEEEDRILQEKLDEELAQRLQDEIERSDRDKKLAIEAQDRELAKMLHQRERERLKRAKERARMKAAAAAANSAEASSEPHLSPSAEMNLNIYPMESSHRTPSRSSSGTSGGDPKSPTWTDGLSPPKIPEKTRIDRDDPLTFRAAPRALPPHPQLISSQSESRRVPNAYISSPLYIPPDEPIPPYMPLQGLQNLGKKRNK